MAQKKKKKVSASKKKERLPRPIRVKLLGIGGGGGSIVAGIASSLSKASFLVANTDYSALNNLPAKVRAFYFGEEFTRGIGTGMNIEIAALAAKKEKERMEKALEGTDLLIMISCLGGGTGSGAAPVFARLAKKVCPLSFGVFTLPFSFEGEKKRQIAETALRKLRANLNAYSLIPNERVFQVVDKKVPIQGALAVINDTLARSLQGLMEMIYDPGLINVDFADLETILEGRGLLAYLHQVTGEAGRALEKITQDVLKNPLYPYGIGGAKRVLFNILGSSNLALAEVAQISEAIFERVGRESKIIFGVRSKKNQKEIEISLLAVGCGRKNRTAKPVLKARTKKTKKKSLPERNHSKHKPNEKKNLAPRKTTPTLTVKTKPVEPAPTPPGEKNKPKARKNALQVQKAVQQLEEEILKQEEAWETPAFLRRK